MYQHQKLQYQQNITRAPSLSSLVARSAIINFSVFFHKALKYRVIWKDMLNYVSQINKHVMFINGIIHGRNLNLHFI